MRGVILRQNRAADNDEAPPLTEPLLAAEPGLSSRVVRASAWTAGLQAVVRMASLIRLAIVARLVGPHEFGLVALAMVAMSSVQAFSTPGITVALLQPGRQERPLLDTAWTLLVVRGLAVAALVFLAAPLVGALFDAPRVVPLLRVLALGPILDGLANIGLVEYRRSLFLRRYLVIQAWGPIADMVVSIALALWLRDAWALVGGWIAMWTVRLVASYAGHPFRPRWRLDRTHARRLLGYGRWVSASASVSWLLSEGVNGVVGRVAGIDALGFFRTARPLGMVPTTEVASLVSWVTVAAYAHLQDDRARARLALLRVLALVAVVAVPAATVTLMFAEPLVRMLLGDRWLVVAPLVRLFAIMGLLRAVTAVVGAALQGLGRPALATRAALVELAVVVTAGPWLLVAHGATGMAAAAALGALAGALAAIRAAGKIAGVSPGDVVSRVGWPALAVAPGAALATWLGPVTSTWQLLVWSTTVLIVYAAALGWLERLKVATSGPATLVQAWRSARRT
jgi:O-antigen/teichoic acid export membrane protein